MTQSLIENNLRFPGQYYDAETDTHYNFMRDYDPATGRYLTSDPIGLDGGINLYAYAQQDPISIFDIDGMKAQMCCKKIPGVAAAHCYIVIDPDEYYGLHGGPLEGRSGCGQVIRNHGFDRDHPSPKECGPWTDNCTVDDCVRKAASGYNNPTNYSYVFGAGNSNTFAHHVAGSCGIKEPPYVPWYPFGKNKKPAKQKKGTTKQGIVDAFGGNGFNQCPSPPPPFPPSYSDPHGSK